MNKKILEILVDKNNEKGPAIFHEILVVLHKAYNPIKETESFSFEIAKIGNRIRFFLISPKKYVNFLSNQIYAHFSNVEIYEVGDYLRDVPADKIAACELQTQKHFLYSIKTFENNLEVGK